MGESILQVLTEPMTSTEILNSIKEYGRYTISSKLSKMYRSGKLARSSHKLGSMGYVYCLPKDRNKINQKIMDMTPERVKNCLQLLFSGQLLTYTDLMERTGITPDEIDLWLKGVYVTFDVVRVNYYKGILFFQSVKSGFTEKDFEERLKGIKSKTKIEGREYEKRILEQIKTLGTILEKQGHTVEYYRHPGTKEGKFLDAMLKVKLFGLSFPIRLMFEVKSYVCNTNDIYFLLRKLRHCDGIVLPIIIARGFTSNCYRFFGHSGVMLLEESKLKKMIEKGKEFLRVLREV